MSGADGLHFANAVLISVDTGGFLFAYAAARPAIHGLDAQGFTEAYRLLNRRADRFMPLLGVAAAVTAAIILVRHHQGDAETVLMAIGFAGNGCNAVLVAVGHRALAAAIAGRAGDTWQMELAAADRIEAARFLVQLCTFGAYVGGAVAAA